MEVRTIRVRMAAIDPPMVIAGRTRYSMPPEPETGNQPSLIAQRIIRSGPSAMLGNDKPNRLTTEIRRSFQRFGCCAEYMPAGIDKMIATNKDANVSSTE